MRFVWIITVTRYGWDHWHDATDQQRETVEVASDEAAARRLVTIHGELVGCYLDDWALVERDGEVVSVGLEGDYCEVTATRWEVKT